MVRGGCGWAAMCIVAMTLLSPTARASAAPEGGLEVYRVWQSMADPAPIKVDIVPGWEIDDLMDNVEAKLRAATHQYGDWKLAVVNLVSREGTEIEYMSDIPASRKVFVLCGTESFFFPTDNIGEEFDVKLAHSSSTVKARVLSNTPRLLEVPNFLTDAECDRLVAAAKPKMKRSTVELTSDNLGKTHEDRTSSTAWMMDGDDAFVPTLHERVEDLVKVPKSYSESLQVLHYAPGQQYKVHHDYIQVYEEDPRFKGGHNRMITVFFYLNDVEEGGGTVFPYALMPRDKHDTVKNYGTCEEAVEPALRVKPRKGSAIIFYHLMPEGQHENQHIVFDPTSLHGGCKPVSGDKWAANFWVRNGPFSLGGYRPHMRRRGWGKGEGGKDVPGVDYSWPMHHYVDEAKETMLSSQVDEYKKYMDGCRERYPTGKGQATNQCDLTERQRVEMLKDQPAMSLNYTRLGYAKQKLPEALFEEIRAFWKAHHMTETDEAWNAGNTFTNHWAAPSALVSLEDPRFPEGRPLKDKIFELGRPMLEEWTGLKLKPVSCYGIRVYKQGGILSPHVDRDPLVTSAIINVDQDVDEDWPLEVIGHDGKSRNVTIKPGEIIYYESHSVIHGRPYPLQGRHFANIFLHYQPYHPYNVRGDSAKDETGKSNVIKKVQVKTNQASSSNERGPQAARSFAAVGHLEPLTKLLSDVPEHEAKKVATAKDHNDWEPIHEAARGGHLEVVKLLEKFGADIHKRTNKGRGWTPLHLARASHGDNHPLVKYLEEKKAADIGAEF